MMDTEVFFRNGRRFTDEYNNIPSSLMASDSTDSTSSEGNEVESFHAGINTWNYDSGLQPDFERILDQFGYDDNFQRTITEWENTVDNEDIDQKPIFQYFDPVNEDVEQLNGTTKEEFITTAVDLGTLKQENLYLSELPLLPFSENIDHTELSPALDLCAFINDDYSVPPAILDKKPRIQAGRKRIDFKAQRYIVDEDVAEEEDDENVDVETISENGNNPVLEAGDLDSLLEQFEATEAEVQETTPTKDVSEEQKKVANEVKDINESEQITNPKKGSLPDAANEAKSVQKVEKSKSKPQIVTSKPVTPVNNKQIIEALPQELINRIKESGKRKRIAIIDPVPNNGCKKRKTQDANILQAATNNTQSTQVAHPNLYNISLDHNYCTIETTLKKNPTKDSGYISPEDDDKSLHNQPIVKNADGTLMISLLKMNTIRNNSEENKKKKLNIEEYKKRRLGVLTTPNSSQSSSPITSSCSSPLPEDENTKRLKHEEKLRKMAEELLNTTAKSSTVNVKTEPDVKLEVAPARVIAPPVDMDVITYVSIGVNTDVSGRNPMIPVAEKLEEIKPLLANAKISSNSLITSLIENIPKAIKPDRTEEVNKAKDVHGEDKTVIYLPKDRKPPKTLDIGVQTSITLLEDNKRRYRRRKDSSTSCSSNGSEVNRSNRSNRSQGSRYSKSSRSSRSTSVSSSSSSRSSVRSRSFSRSRSPSPHRTRKRRSGYNKDYVQEVEERRVVYVGKIAPNTTKQDLYRRFSRFGPIKTISLHFRDHGYTNLDNYGFVTFTHNVDAYEAIEHGNDDPYDIHYDLSFGGRRLFCKTTYSDLDNVRDDLGYGGYVPAPKPTSAGDESFDRLLKEVQEKLKRRKV